MSKSDYLENRMLDHVLGGPTYNRRPTVYVSLHTASVGDDGLGAEVSAGGYVRTSVANNSTNWPAAVGGLKSNGTLIQFAAATAAWGTVTYFGIWDAASGGNLLRWGVLGTPQIIQSGDAPYFEPGYLICMEY